MMRIVPEFYQKFVYLRTVHGFKKGSTNASSGSHGVTGNVRMGKRPREMWYTQLVCRFTAK